MLHALRDCPRAWEVLVGWGFDNRMMVKQFNSCIDRLEDPMRTLDKKALEDLFVVLWNIWNSRNNFIFRGKEEEARTFWEKPQEGFFKINVDVAVNNFGTGLGIIIRDSNGFVLKGRGIFKERAVNSEWAELNALFEGIGLARCLNLNKVNLEMDCASIVNRVRKARAEITIFGHRIKETQSMLDSFNEVDIRWIDKCCNRVADFLWYWSLKNCCNLDFDMDYASEIHNL